MKKWKINDRVTRPQCFDDGTWRREGDKCIPSSSLKHGTVISRSTARDDEVFVRFDNGTISSCLDHGLDSEVL
jgi:hypothetical protein